MTPAPEASLADLLHAEGLIPGAENLRWMVLTWDLARFGAENKFYRLFCSLDTALGVAGHRAPGVFDAFSPVLGRAGMVVPFDDSPLQWAHRITEQRINEGYVPVCRPLAVDCSPLRPDHFDHPGQLLPGLQAGTESGMALLGHINAVRATAAETHVHPDAAQVAGRRTLGQLWAGI